MGNCVGLYGLYRDNPYIYICIYTYNDMIGGVYIYNTVYVYIYYVVYDVYIYI